MKFPLLLCSLLGLLASSAGAEEIRRISLEGAPGVPAPVQEDGKDGIARIKKVPQPALEIFPTSQKPSKGTVMISPGGGYSILAVGHEGRDVAKLLNAAGWDAAVLLYRVSEGPTTRDLAIADAKAGLALLQKRGGEFGLSTQRVGAMGFSAGGHLTARLGHEADVTPSFLVLIYAAYLEKEGKTVEEVMPKVPVFLYVAGDDKWSASSVAYVETCKQLGLQHEFYKPERGGHGFGLKNPLPEGVRDWPDKLRAFLEKVAK